MRTILVALLCLLPGTTATINSIAWTFSKPPAKFLTWTTSKTNPEFTMASLTPGAYVLQAIATDVTGTSIASGILQGNITLDEQTIQLILNPLIQADATRYQQPSYIKWIKTNSTSAYTADIIELTIKGQSNPPNVVMQFTINQQVVCTTATVCVFNYTVPSTDAETLNIDVSIVGMGYSIPVVILVKPFVPVQFRAIFNIPPIITHINSAHSLLHQIGTSTTITATFTDEDSSDIKFTWTITAIQGTCLASELSGVFTGTVASGSTVSIVYTPTSLDNKCIVQIRCEDAPGAVSLGEVYIYVNNIPVYFPPYVVSNYQSSQTGKIGDRIDVALELCEPQHESVTTTWSCTCGTIDHSQDIVINTEECFWLYNHAILSSVPCNIVWTSQDSTGSVTSNKFRILDSAARRLSSTPIVTVITNKESLKTIMSWPNSPHEKIVGDKDGITGEGIGLIVVCTMLIIGMGVFLIMWKRKAVNCTVSPLTEEVVSKQQVSKPFPEPLKKQETLVSKKKLRVSKRQEKFDFTKRPKNLPPRKNVIRATSPRIIQSGGEHPMNDSQWITAIKKTHHTTDENVEDVTDFVMHENHLGKK